MSPRLQWVRALAAAGALGASLGLGLAQCFGSFEPLWFVSNAVPEDTRVSLLCAAITGALVAALAVLLALLRFGTDPVSRALRFLAPLGLAFALPALFQRETWTSAVDACVSMAMAVVIARPLFRLHVSVYPDSAILRELVSWMERVPPAWRRRLVVGLVVTAALAYAVYMGTFTVFNHRRFGTYNFDLAQFDNEFFNTLHGRPFRDTCLLRKGAAWSTLATHAHFGVWFLLPFYALRPSAETLLMLQASIVGVGAIPLYRFAARRLSSVSAAVLAIAYLFYPPLHGAQFFDFHFQAISATCVLFAVDFFDARRMGWFTLFFVLALACREDVPIGMATIAFYALLYCDRTLGAALTLVASVAYFVLMRFIVMPHVGNWVFVDFYSALTPPGQKGFGAVIVTIFTNPVFAFTTLIQTEKLRYLLQLLTPLAFLPLTKPRLWLSLVLGSLVTVFTNKGPMIDIAFQYGPSFAPYVFLASAIALSVAGREPPLVTGNVNERRAALASLVFGTLLMTVHYGAIPPRENFHGAYYKTIRMAPLNAAERERYRVFQMEVARIPKDAILAAGDREIPHVSNRLDAWNFADGYEGADYIIYDPVNPLPNERVFGAEARAKGWTVVAEHPRLIVLKKPPRH